jgi:hypothetical protein
MPEQPSQQLYLNCSGPVQDLKYLMDCWLESQVVGPCVRVSFSCTLAPIPKGFQPKALIKTPSSYLFSDYLELTD